MISPNHNLNELQSKLSIPFIVDSLCFRFFSFSFLSIKKVSSKVSTLFHDVEIIIVKNSIQLRINVARPQIFSLWHFSKETQRLIILSELIREPSWFSKQIAGFPKWGRLVGRQFGQIGQKLHENYKIGISGSKQWGNMGVDKPIFRVVWGIPPVPPPPTRGNPGLTHFISIK